MQKVNKRFEKSKQMTRNPGLPKSSKGFGQNSLDLSDLKIEI